MKNKDVYGSALYDYYKGDLDEMDPGWIASSRRYFTTYNDWFPREQKAISFAKGKVLDIGCAAGRHSLYLQEKGFEVTSIDYSPKSIEVCKERGLKNTDVLALNEIPHDYDKFDTIMMLGNNFGLVGTIENAKRILELFDDITNKNATLILGSCGINLENMTTSFANQVNYNIDKGRYYGEVKYSFQYKKMKDEVNWIWVKKEDIIELILDSNFYIDQIIEDDIYGSPFPYVVIAKKRK